VIAELELSTRTSKPIKRKITELRAKARYSQNVATATRVEALMPVRAAKLPHSMPAVTVAITPEKWKCSAATNDP
jgi:hypothetical protein